MKVFPFGIQTAMEANDVFDSQVPLSRSSSVGSMSSVASGSSVRSKTYLCEYDNCDKAFTRPSLLTEHQNTVHLGRKPWKCNQCESSFTKKIHLERHLYTHTDERPFYCSFCGKGLITRQQLKRHEVTHTKSFNCEYEGCNESFYKHPQLRAHILAVHLQSLKCHECNKCFQRPYRLKNHIAKHHNPDVVNAYQCTFSVCSKSFKTWSALRLHVKNDHPKLKCPICSKPCVGEDGLNMHMKIHDENLVSRNWKCHICNDQSFAKKLELLDHYSNSHSEEIPAYLLEQKVVPYVETNVAGKTECEKSPTKKYVKATDILAIRTETNLNRFFDGGKDAMTLLLNTVGRKFRCPYSKCYRSFKTEEKYNIHIEKHRIHEQKLKELETSGQLQMADIEPDRQSTALEKEE